MSFSIRSPFLSSFFNASALSGYLSARERDRRIGSVEFSLEQFRDSVRGFDALTPAVDALRRAADRLRAENDGAIDFTTTSSNASAATAQTNSGFSGAVTVTVNSLASAGAFDFGKNSGAFKLSSEAIAPKLDDDLAAKARTITFLIGSSDAPAEASVVVTSTTTLDDFAAAVNASSSATASIVDVGASGSPDLRVVVRSAAAGTADGAFTVQFGAGLADPNQDGDTADSIFANAVVTEPSDAVFSISGIAETITRGSNSVSDVLPGTTLHLHGVGETVLTSTAEPSDAAAAVRTFVDAFNSLAGTVRRGNSPLDGALRGTSIDDRLVETVRSGLFSAPSSSGLGAANIGISTGLNGTLRFDEAEFRSAAASAPAAVNDLLASFGAVLGGVGGVVDQFDGAAGLIAAAKQRSSDRIRAYETQITRLEGLLADRSTALAARYGRLELTLTRLESQASLLGALFGRTDSPFSVIVR